MDREEFKTKLDSSQPTKFFDEKRKSIEIENLSSLNDNSVGTANLIIAMEELAECQQQISKVIRGKGDSIGLLEEVADAYIALDWVRHICNIKEEDLKKAMNVKLDRLHDRYIKEVYERMDYIDGER